MPLEVPYKEKSNLAKSFMRVPVHWNGYVNKFELVDEAYSDVEFFDVEYYNPNSGTQSTYTLAVEIEDDLLTLIHWPNGSWLDESHFTAPELSENEEASFTSERG